MRRELNACDWDLVVIGAGPAGAFAARQAGRQGIRTLLLEGKPFPRDKVCGGCLNFRAVQTLRQAGLDQVLEHASPINSLWIHSASRFLELSLPSGLALSRKTLDQFLVEAAVSAGVKFLDETSATVHPDLDAQFRRVTLTSHGQQTLLRTRTVLVADGLLRSSVRHLPQFASHVARHSYLGAGATLLDSSTHFPAGRITMAIGKSGYVGLTRFETGELNVAAAFSPASVKRNHSLNILAAETLRHCGLPLPESIDTAPWHGTPLLTSHPAVVAAERIFLVGDSAGYVEPFTGEGIAAALESANAVIPLVAESLRNWHPGLIAAWTIRHQRAFRDRQWISRTLSPLLRNRTVVNLLMQGCHWLPAIPKFLIRKINHPGNLPGSTMQGCL